MIVILLKDVKGTGKAGDIVKVSDGYARNMLIPRGFATEATGGSVRNLEKQKAAVEEKRAQEHKKAEELSGRVSGLTVNITTKAGDGGRLFGSITTMDVADALNEQHGIDIDKRKFVMEAPIKHTGEYEIQVKLYHEVSAKLKVNVTT